MLSDDVIELGSSDEDIEPARKKPKPIPNAMVCIPKNLRDVTITPAKPNPATIAKGLGKSIIVRKIGNNKQLNVTKNKVLNGSPDQKPKNKFCVNPLSDLPKSVIVQNIPIKKVLPIVKPSTKVSNTKCFNPNIPKMLKKPVKIQPSGALNLLPPSITVKKTSTNNSIVRLNVKGTNKINQSTVGDVLTVELDDDEAPVNRSSPQWYVRPEDQLESSSLEEENNKEPDKPKMIEITIEDSPIKPILNKKTHTVGAELSITIDDSPVKVMIDKNKSGSESDNETGDNDAKTPHSKKQLVYPQQTENKKTLEIEIEPHEVSVNKLSDAPDKQDEVSVSQDDENNKQDVDLAQGTDKGSEEKPESSTSKDCIPEIQKKESDPSEFHPVYQKFIDLCFQLENSDDMKTIVEKKIKGYYKQVPKEYTESEEFTDMVSSKILAMKAGPEKMYLYIKDVVDELNLQRKLAKAQPVLKETKDEEAAELYGGESEYDSKRQRQIRKLEKTIKKLHRAIQKLEEQEVDFDDEDDSVYLLTERYKERMVRVYAKFCQLSNTKMPSEPRIQIDPRPGQSSGPAKRLEKWINKKVPIGTPLPFPDFHDVLRCVREANEEDRLNYNEADIMEEARDLFTRCGKKLQRRRQENEWRLAASRISLDIDPAENNDDLKRKLSENKKVAAQKETEIFNKFADRQSQLKLEAVEIGEKEAEESPVESEEEEAIDDNVSLENSEQRKDRLKRLLHEKSKKSTEERENQPNDDEQESKETANVESKDSNAPVDDTSNAETKNEQMETTDEQIETKDEQIETKDEQIETQGEQIETKDAAGVEKNKKDSFDKGETTQNDTETLIVSDDSNGLESDIDELHLLQKLHSANEDQSSSVCSSDSDSPIAISDSLETSDDGKKEPDDDVISIENSSYSENEEDKIEDPKETSVIQDVNEENVISPEEKSPVDDAMQVDSNAERLVEVKAPIQTNNDEYNDAVENILLASSEESNTCDSQEDAVCVNLRDDLISIDETVIGNCINETPMEETPNTSPEEIGTKNNEYEVNIDINVKPTNTTETKLEENSVQNEGVAISEKSKNTVEIMDIDDDSVISESIVLDSPQKVATPPDLRDS